MQGFESFLRITRNKYKFNLFLFQKLPIAFLSGVRIIKMDENRAIVSIPFKFLTKNPFKSVYFASQAMAAELSTGILALAHTYQHKPDISMLVLNMKADFIKKAKTNLFFECAEGTKIKDAIRECIISGSGKTVEIKSTGKDIKENIVAEFIFTWTFKMKT
jgi:hypothetical protein